MVVVEYLTDLCAAAGFADCSAVAAELMLLLDGAIVGAIREGSPAAAVTGRRAAAAFAGRPQRRSSGAATRPPYPDDALPRPN